MDLIKKAVSCKRPHTLHTLKIQLGFARRAAVHAVPVLTEGNGHTGNAKKFIDLVIG